MAEREAPLRPAPPLPRDEGAAERARPEAAAATPELERELQPPQHSKTLAMALRLLAGAERAILVTVAALLVIGSVLLILDTARSAYRVIIEHKALADGIVNTLGQLMLVVILMELLNTVTSFLSRGNFQVRQFLVIGIVSSVRQILLVGAELVVVGTTHPSNTQFVHSQIELVVSASVIVMLAITLRIVGKDDPAG